MKVGLQNIATEDLLDIVNAPISLQKNRFVFAENCVERRCRYEIVDDETIKLIANENYFHRDISWGLSLDWGDKNYLRDFLRELRQRKSIIVKNKEFIEKQKSIVRIQDDGEFQQRLRKETEKLFENGYSSFCAYAVFRATINKGYKEEIVFQKGILRAIDMSFYPFRNWVGWGKETKKYYGLREDVREFAETVRNTTVSLIYEWMRKQYGKLFTLKCFRNALGPGWSYRLHLKVDCGRMC